MSHHGAQYYLRWVEQPLSRCGVDLSLPLPTTVATLTQVKNICSAFNLQCLCYQIFSIGFWIIKKNKSASLLSSAVIWCFLYIRHGFDTAVVATFIRKPFSKIFSIPFCKKTTTKELQQQDFFAFSMIAFVFFFNVVAFFFVLFFKFWILPSLLCHSQFKGFFQYM